MKFIEYLKYKHQQDWLENTLLSQSDRAKDWFTISEDQAWQDLLFPPATPIYW